MKGQDKPPIEAPAIPVAPRTTFETIPQTHMVPTKPNPLSAPASERMAAVIRRVDNRLRRRAQRIVEAIGDGAAIDDDGHPVDGSALDPMTGRPKGWSGVRYQVAKDARKPAKVAPVYISLMTRVHESYQRAEASAEKVPELGKGIQINVQQNTYNYAVKDVGGADALETLKKP